MKYYKYETHVHTSDGSRCAIISAAEQVRFYKSKGYTGICITEHFFNGNTTVPSHLSWTERVEMYCKSYENAKKEGEKVGLDVFFGWEYSYHNTHFLTYGLDKDWLLRQPNLLDMTLNEYCKYVMSEGGFLIQAHPFREDIYTDMIRLLPRDVHGVEAINANRSDFENDRAIEYAENYNLLQIAGSDNHSGEQKRLAGIKLTRPLKDIHDMIRAIKNKETEIFVE